MQALPVSEELVSHGYPAGPSCTDRRTLCASREWRFWRPAGSRL